MRLQVALTIVHHADLRLALGPVMATLPIRLFVPASHPAVKGSSPIRVKMHAKDSIEPSGVDGLNFSEQRGAVASMKSLIGGRACKSIGGWRDADPAHMAVSKEICVRGSILHIRNRELGMFRLTMWLTQTDVLS